MKLNELKSFHAEVDIVLENAISNFINDSGSPIQESAAMVSAISLYNSIKSLMKMVYDLSGKKNSLNDETLRRIYVDELQLLKDQVEKLPSKSRGYVERLLDNNDIKLTGVDLSRKNLNRIIVVKIIRFFISAIENFLQNPVESLLNSVMAGLGTAVSAILNAKDGKGLLSEIGRTASQIRTIIQKISR